MTDSYSKLYSVKREQMTVGNNRMAVSNANVELEKARSNSPAPNRNNSKFEKVAHAKDIEKLQKLFETLESNITVMYDNLKNDLKLQIDNTKNEALKVALNDAVRSFNESVKSLSTEMVNHLDEINTLKSKVCNIEEVL